MTRAEQRGYRLKKPPTMITPSAETNPLESRLISSKNKTDESAAVPSGIALYILVVGFGTRTEVTQKYICLYTLYIYIYISIHIYIYIYIYIYYIYTNIYIYLYIYVYIYIYRNFACTQMYLHTPK